MCDLLVVQSSEAYSSMHTSLRTHNERNVLHKIVVNEKCHRLDLLAQAIPVVVRHGQRSSANGSVIHDYAARDVDVIM